MPADRQAGRRRRPADAGPVAAGRRDRPARLRGHPRPAARPRRRPRATGRPGASRRWTSGRSGGSTPTSGRRRSPRASTGRGPATPPTLRRCPRADHGPGGASDVYDPADPGAGPAEPSGRTPSSGRRPAGGTRTRRTLDVPAVPACGVRPVTTAARFDLERAGPAPADGGTAAGRLAVDWADGQSVDCPLVLPVATCDRLTRPVTLDGVLDDWFPTDAALLERPLVRMSSRPAVQAGEARPADHPTSALHRLDGRGPVPRLRRRRRPGGRRAVGPQLRPVPRRPGLGRGPVRGHDPAALRRRHARPDPARGLQDRRRVGRAPAAGGGDLAAVRGGRPAVRGHGRPGHRHVAGRGGDPVAVAGRRPAAAGRRCCGSTSASTSTPPASRPPGPARATAAARRRWPACWCSATAPGDRHRTSAKPIRNSFWRVLYSRRTSP